MVEIQGTKTTIIIIEIKIIIKIQTTDKAQIKI